MVAGLIAIVTVLLSFCVCEVPASAAVDECHGAEPAAAGESSRAGGTWNRGDCCELVVAWQPAVLASRPCEPSRSAGVLAVADLSAAATPEKEAASASATSAWLTAASPPNAPPTAFVLPLRI